MTRIDIITIFPDYLSPLRLSLIGKAIDNGTVDLRIHDLRDQTTDRHRTVDDTPTGGGPGMVMMAEPWGLAIDSVLADGPTASRPRLVIPTPSGRVFTAEVAAEFADADWLIFACGRYEGIDSRVAEYFASRIRVDQVSIGDYVLAGGEAAALVMVEAAVRLIPGVLGNEGSTVDDSFAPGRDGAELEGPIFTKPASWRGLDVPEVLLSGDHAAIEKWRADAARSRTQEYRSDLGKDSAHS